MRPFFSDTVFSDWVQRFLQLAGVIMLCYVMFFYILIFLKEILFKLDPENIQ